MKLTYLVTVLFAVCLTIGCSTHYVKQSKSVPTTTNLSSFIAGGGLSTSSNGNCTLTISYKNGRSTPIQLNDSICTDAKNAIVAAALTPPAPAPKAAPPAASPAPAAPSEPVK